MNKQEQCKNKAHQHSKIIEFLDNADRMEAYPPEKILELLPIKDAKDILDLGAGTGYLSIPAARISDGIVHALDMNTTMLDIIDSKAKDANLKNIELIQGSIDKIPMEDNSIDIVLASLVLHEVSPLSKTLLEIKRVLKDGGYFLCLEYDKQETSLDGPPMHIRISTTVMAEELNNAGFTLAEKMDLKDSVYIITSRK